MHDVRLIEGEMLQLSMKDLEALHCLFHVLLFYTYFSEHVISDEEACYGNQLVVVKVELVRVKAYHGITL